jgi:hypothetical protein
LDVHPEPVALKAEGRISQSDDLELGKAERTCFEGYHLEMEPFRLSGDLLAAIGQNFKFREAIGHYGFAQIYISGEIEVKNTAHSQAIGIFERLK